MNLTTPSTKPTLNILVTSGGTNVPLDAVRVLSNTSRGTTGALIAQHALQLGKHVHYLCSVGTRTPYETELLMKPGQGIESELERLKQVGTEFLDVSSRLVIERVKNFNDYRERVLDLAAGGSCDVVIACMAASDFGVTAQAGKISSDQTPPILEMFKLPKVVSEIKAKRNDLFLVGFKFLIDSSPDALIEAAYNNMLRDKQDLCVANTGPNISEAYRVQTFIITAEKGIIPVNREDLPKTLMRLIDQRHSHHYFQTKLTKVQKLPLPEPELEAFLAATKKFANLALFPSYLDGSRAEFGFVATRSSAGTLITGRGSSKSDVNISDLAIVTGIDLEQRSLEVTSTGRKASLNANLAELIFKSRPEINCIVHAHIFLPQAVSVGRDTSPGTLEDWVEIQPLVTAGHNVIAQPNHGVIILLESPAELTAILESNNLYANNGAAYDLAYQRFLGRNRLIELSTKGLDQTARILDMAAGTGDVSTELLRRGYSNLFVTDPAPAMLEQAKVKLAEQLPADRLLCGDMQTFSSEHKFERIIIRQAINYISPVELTKTLINLRHNLVSGGQLHFNTFQLTSESPKPRTTRQETDSHVIITQEGNLVEGEKILHGQRTEIYGKGHSEYQLLYDFNSFYYHTADSFLKAATQAGFSEVTFLREGSSLYICCKNDLKQ